MRKTNGYEKHETVVTLYEVEFDVVFYTIDEDERVGQKFDVHEVESFTHKETDFYELYSNNMEDVNETLLKAIEQ